MIVRSVRLENVKSYGSPPVTIDFAPGVNAICGPNGAGKSTILEAIGCALFQYTPYNQQAFVREGEATGRITVVVESGLDERAYEISRQIGKGARHSVHDPDLGQRVADGEEDVSRWLHQHLGLAEDTDLKTLFLDAVGPPQGTLTSIFLEPAMSRRAKFNRLLRVEEYEQAFQKLLALTNELREQQRVADERIRGLAQQTEGIPEKAEELALVRAAQATLATDLARLVAEEDLVRRELAVLVERERAVQEARTACQLSQERARQARSRHETAVHERDEAAKAAATSARSRAGHDAYRAADAELDHLEADRRARDALRATREEAAREDITASADLRRVEDLVQIAEAAGRDAEALAARIPEQEAAERQLQQAMASLKQRESLLDELPRRREMLRRAERRVAETARALDEAEGFRPVAATLAERQAAHERAREHARAAHNAHGEQQATEPLIEEDRRAYKELKRRLDEIDRRIGAAEANRSLAAELPRAEEAYRLASAARATADGQLHHARATREQVTGGICPFLRESCKNLRPGVTLEEHFDGEIVHWSREIERLSSRVAEAETRLAGAREASLATAGLAEWQADRAVTAEQLRQTEAQGRARRERLDTIKALADALPDREREEREALAALREAQAAADRVAEIPRLRSEREGASHDRDEWARSIAQLEEQIARLAAAERDKREAEARLKELNGPRELAEHLRIKAAKLPEYQRERDEIRAAIDRLRRDVADLDARLAPYATLDGAIADAQRRRDENRPFYEAYVGSIQLASTLSSREADLIRSTAELEMAEWAEADANLALEAADAAYDAAGHARATERKSAIERDRATVQARIEASARDEERITAELDALLRVQSQLQATRAELEETRRYREVAETLRQTIRDAGPEITKRIIRGISRVATRINAELMAAPGVELAWTDEYAIVTRRGADERGFALLSGGEQMAAALAVRLALLRELSDVKVAFLDEPTAHLDVERRTNLGEQIQRLRGFDQLIVISHDDTFDGLFGHVVRVGRRGNQSVLVDDALR